MLLIEQVYATIVCNNCLLIIKCNNCLLLIIAIVYNCEYASRINANLTYSIYIASLQLLIK